MAVSRAARRRLAWLGVGLAAVGFAVAVWRGSGPGAPQGAQLAYLASRSLARMIAAFAVSLAFALTYGYTAATSKRAARVLVPLLDVLQSVPILAFFPVAVVFFVSLFNGSLIGLEGASVFLIFTSQAWNMAFSVYESILGLPNETADAASVFGVKGWLRVKRVLLPAVIPKLLYNSIFSWAGGWYFVTASEVISAKDEDIVLPGLGSYIFHASESGDVVGLLTGIGVLVLAVLVFEFLLWRPLAVYVERFKFDSARGAAGKRSAVMDFYRFLRGEGRRTRRALKLRPLGIIPRPSDRVARILRVGAFYAFTLLLSGVAALLAVSTVNALRGPLSPDMASIPLALLASTLRLGVAYAFTVLWAVPLAVWIARNERASAIVMPTVEVLASIPAVALFPVILLVFVQTTGTLGLGSVVLALTGMQWYLLFNLIAGARNIPESLVSVAQVSGLKGWRLWRRIYIPGMMTSFITGSITAWGGGWNALIISEYVRFGGKEYGVFGIGYLIDKATLAHDGALLLVSVLSMVAFIMIVNGAVWKPLYRKAIAKYQLEG